MKKITQSFLTLLLLMVMGVVSANAKTEKVHATFESPTNTNTTWNSETKTFTWSTTYYNQLRNIGLPNGDISKYKKLVVDCTIKSGEKFRVLFYKGGSNLTLYAEDGVNEFIIKDELEKVSPEGYNEYLLGCDEICLSGNNGAAPGEAVINDVYLETYDDEGEKTYATFESPTNTNTTWNSETKTFTWSTTYYNQLRNIGLPNGDISKYKKLVVDCTIKSGEKFRVLFYKGGSNLTLYAEDGVNEFIIKDELEKVSPEGYNEYLLACDEICLSGNNGAAPGEAIINSVYLETYPENESVEIPEIEYEEDPGKPEGEYIDFTEAFPELSPKIGIGEDTHPIVIGNGDVVVGQRSKNVIADLSDYSTLTLVTTPGLKLVVYMNHEVDAQQNLGDYAAEDEGKYEFIEAQTGEDGLYTLDLTQYDKQDLNCICLPWDNTNKGTVWYILLQKGEAEPEPAAYTITIAATENGTVAADVEEAAEGDKVTLTITPAEGYELDQLSVAAGETAVEVAEDNSFTMPAAAVTVTATFKEFEPEPEPEPEPVSNQDLTLDLFHLWTGFGADATIADPDNNSGACVVGEATGCPYGDSNVGELQFADLSAWDYLTLVVTSDAPRLFFNAKSQSDRISVLPDDEKYLISKEDGVYVYDLAAIKADAGYVHLNSIKASAWNTQITVSEMKLTLAEPEHEIADLAKDMFHKWTGFDAEATVADPDENGGGVNLNAETDCPYGNTNVTEYEYADLSDWDYLTLVVKSDNPRLFFNSKGGNDRITVLVNDEKYVKSNEDGVIVYDLAAIKADAGFVHLNSIKASAWNTKTIVTEMKLATVEPYIPEAEGEATTYAITIAATENGTVSADVEEAAEGDKVALTITPAEGYELDELSVTAGETAVEVAEDNIFTMPAAEVTVTATFKESSDEPEPESASSQDLTLDFFHLWTGFGADATIADPDNNSGACVVGEATGCPYGDSNVGELQFADLSAWDYLTLVVTSDAPRLFFNAKSQSDRISVLPDDEKYLISKEDGVYVYDLAAIKADAGYVHLNSIKASAWNTQITVSEMKLTLAEPEHEIADLAKDMFHKWTGFDAEATVADPDENGGGVNLNAETDCPYGNTNVTEYEYADLSDWDYLTLVVKSDNPRLFFNSKGGNDRITVLVNDEKYVKSNEDGVIVYDLAAIKADAGFVHLNSIKASAWNTKTIVTEMKLATVEPYIPEAEGEATTYAITIAATENGTVSADVEEAAEGDKVTLTITPAEGYELDELSVTAGETTVEVDVDNTFIMPAAAVTVTAAFKETETEHGEEDLLSAPETDSDYADFTKIPFAQEDQETGDIHLAPMEDKGAYTQFTTTDGICVVFKMKNVDVTDCDYITIKFAKPCPAGQAYAVWTGNTNKAIDEGEDEIKYVFANDPDCKIENGILPEVSIISIFTGAGREVSVYGVYKHKAIATDINEVEGGETLANGKYIENGQIVIVKDGVKYNVAGQVIK